MPDEEALARGRSEHGALRDVFLQHATVGPQGFVTLDLKVGQVAASHQSTVRSGTIDQYGPPRGAFFKRVSRALFSSDGFLVAHIASSVLGIHSATARGRPEHLNIMSFGVVPYRHLRLGLLLHRRLGARDESHRQESRSNETPLLHDKILSLRRHMIVSVNRLATLARKASSHRHRRTPAEQPGSDEYVRPSSAQHSESQFMQSGKSDALTSSESCEECKKSHNVGSLYRRAIEM